MRESVSQLDIFLHQIRHLGPEMGYIYLSHWSIGLLLLVTLHKLTVRPYCWKTTLTSFIEQETLSWCLSRGLTSTECSWYWKILCMLSKEKCEQQASLKPLSVIVYCLQDMLLQWRCKGCVSNQPVSDLT